MLSRKDAVQSTNPARTLADLSGSVSPPVVRRARRQAAILGLSLGAELPDATRSELERVFLALLRRHRLPPPEVNAWLEGNTVGARPAGYTVDFLWREQRLVVETDGYTFHRGRQAFEDDRGRDLALRLRGFEVLRFSYRQVVDEPKRVAGLIRNLIEG